MSENSRYSFRLHSDQFRSIFLYPFRGAKFRALTATCVVATHYCGLAVAGIDCCGKHIHTMQK